MLDVTPSTRSFGQAIDRQRQALERVPLLQGERRDLAEAMRALDEAEAAALAVEVGAELTRFSDAARSVSIPVLRADEIIDEFRIYESRAAGADAILLRAAALPPQLLERLCRAAASTHMAPCVVCASAEEMARAASLRAIVALESEALLASAPRRTLLLALRELPGLRGRADAVLDPELTSPRIFRESLEKD